MATLVLDDIVGVQLVQSRTNQCQPPPDPPGV